MELIKVKDYEELSVKAAKIISGEIAEKKTLTIALPSGSTPVGMFHELVNAVNSKKTTFKNVKAFLLDEYCDIKYNKEQSIKYFVNYHLFSQINIEEENIFTIKTDEDDLNKVCNDYNKLLEENPIDIQVLGIGANGHIGFNEPNGSFDLETHISKLAFKTRLDNQRFFNSINEVPSYAVTMGIKSILKAKHIILLISGAAKADALKRLLTLEVSEEFPASCLINHPNVTVIVDESACSGLK